MEVQSQTSEANSRIISQNTIESRERTEQLYKDQKLLYPYKDFSQLRPHRGTESHIFNTEPNEPIRTGKKIINVKDSVIFNDNYKERPAPNKFHRKRVENNLNYNTNTRARIFPKDNEVTFE